jgi:hypothetical protein
MKETAEDLFKRLGFDYNTLVTKYGGTAEWYQFLKEIDIIIKKEEKKSEKYLTIKNFNNITGKQYTHSGDSFYIHSVEEFDDVYDIDCEYRGEENVNISVQLSRIYDSAEKGYKFKIESNTNKNFIKYLKKEDFQTPSSFIDMIENFLMFYIIPLPF